MAPVVQKKKKLRWFLGWIFFFFLLSFLFLFWRKGFRKLCHLFNFIYLLHELNMYLIIDLSLFILDLRSIKNFESRIPDREFVLNFNPRWILKTSMCFAALFFLKFDFHFDHVSSHLSSRPKAHDRRAQHILSETTFLIWVWMQNILNLSWTMIIVALVK